MIPEIESAKSVHDPEVSGQAVLVQVVVGKVQDFEYGECSESARKTDKTIHCQIQDSGKTIVGQKISKFL